MSTNRDDGPGADVAGGPVRHIPVLLDEVLTALAVQPASVHCDGTFGGGGYTRAILSTASDVRVVAIDRDPNAVRDSARLVEAAGSRLKVVEGRFGDLDKIVARAGFTGIDGVVLDIGVSSMQIDEAERGFSFRHDSTLDMRMEQQGRSAAEIVNEDSAERLADILYYYGEERRARAIARKIVEERAKAPIETTGRLVEIVTMIERPKPNQIHPATRTFQALRIAVNDELGELVRGLHAAERVLKPGGRLVVVTFHSLEDRIVKQFLALRSGRGVALSRHLPGEAAAPDPTFRLIERGAIAASEAEIMRNPRSRSAKLRVAERTAATARSVDAKITALASLPDTPRRGR